MIAHSFTRGQVARRLEDYNYDYLRSESSAILLTAAPIHSVSQGSRVMFALAAFVVGVFVCMRHSAVRVLVCVHRRVCILGVRVLMLRLVVVHVFVSVRYAVLMRVRMVMRFVCHVIRSRRQVFDCLRIIQY